MISIFRKRQRVNYQSHALQSIKNKFDYRLRLLADYLAMKAERLSPNTLAVLIIAFCITIAACFCYITITSSRYSKFIEIQNIRAPAIKHSIQSNDDNVLLRRLSRFHKYLDSLKQSDSTYYQIIVNQRPHLIDSLIQAEKLLRSTNF